jgi:hypothetical protein
VISARYTCSVVTSAVGAAPRSAPTPTALRRWARTATTPRHPPGPAAALTELGLSRTLDLAVGPSNKGGTESGPRRTRHRVTFGGNRNPANPDLGADTRTRRRRIFVLPEPIIRQRNRPGCGTSRRELTLVVRSPVVARSFKLTRDPSRPVIWFRNYRGSLLTAASTPAMSSNDRMKDPIHTTSST